ncbi:class I tRNA ligase family protein [Candidatus Vidania fulgoroideorum]
MKKQQFVCTSMIPYPSGNLHMGHIRNYTINDVICRKMGIKMFMGWDSFGLPAENFSISKKKTPKLCVKKNIKSMKKQFVDMGYDIVWNKEINTCNRNFYKITQFIFCKLYKCKYIYRGKCISYWDKKDKTTLSKEQIIKGRGWRSGSKVVKRFTKSYFVNLKNSFLKSIIKDIKLSNWPETIKKKQINWIGEEKGYVIKEYHLFFNNIKPFNSLVFSFNNLVLIKKLTKVKKQLNNIISNKNIFYKRNDFIYFVGYKIVYKKKLPVFISDNINFKEFYHPFVLNPFSNIRFKRKMKRKILLNLMFEKGFNTNEIFFKRKTTYKILDWNISRQRYWGTPIPTIVCKNCGVYQERLKNLPVNIKKVKLNNNSDIIKVEKTVINCHKCNCLSYRETDTLDTFFDSSWYFLHYFCKDIRKSKPLDIYIGGEEHSILHLLYSRIIIKILNKIKIVNFKNPFNTLIIQGVILNYSYYYFKNGVKNWIRKINKPKKEIKIYKKLTKMSKSKKNGINPYKYIKRFGVDTLRMYILFIAPINKNFIWNENKIIGCYRFINKVLEFFRNKKNYYYHHHLKYNKFIIKKIEEDINLCYKNFKFNILVSKIMTEFKILKKHNIKNNNVLEKFLNNLYPICPFLVKSINNNFKCQL